MAADPAHTPNIYDAATAVSTNAFSFMTTGTPDVVYAFYWLIGTIAFLLIVAVAAIIISIKRKEESVPISVVHGMIAEMNTNLVSIRNSVDHLSQITQTLGDRLPALYAK
jgi:hypothetical protein